MLVFAVSAVPAADTPSLSGTWQVHVVIGNYDNVITCAFTQNGTALSGTCSTTEDGPAQITGSVSENKVTWTYKTTYNGGTVTPAYEGLVDPSPKITGTITVPELNAQGDFTAAQANTTQSK